jgi:protoporphyrinogen oxidase
MDIIIGAGISGLSYANFSNSKDFLILEKETEPGGYCKTIFNNGFVWDYSGHFFHFRNTEIEKFLVDRMTDTEILKLIKKTQIKYKESLIDFPFQKNIHQLEKDEFIDCLYDLFLKTEKERYSSFKEMLYGKFGKSICEKFLIPYNEKLYACDLNDLDVDAMGRFFPFANIEEIVRNMKKGNIGSYNDTFTYPRKGAIQYINALLKGLQDDKIRYNEELVKIDLNNKTAFTRNNQYKFDRLISSMPLPLLLNTCGIEYDKNIYTWNKVLVFNLGFDKKGNDIINQWIYFPEKEYIFYRIGYYDNILSTNKMSLYVEIGFNKDDEVDTKKTRIRVLSDLKKAGIVTDHKLIAEHNVILDPAYVHVKKDSIADKNIKMEQLSKYGVYSIGRYGDWKYCSIEDNIIEAKNLADQHA